MYDWNDPFARMFLQILAVIAEFEANLIRQRTREGMDIARQNGKLRGKQPRLKPAQDREIRRMHDSGDYNLAEIAALFSVSRPTVYRSLDRTAELPRFPPAPGPYGRHRQHTCAPPVIVTLPAVIGAPCGSVVTRESRLGPAGLRDPDIGRYLGRPAAWTGFNLLEPVRAGSAGIDVGYAEDQVEHAPDQ